MTDFSNITSPDDTRLADAVAQMRSLKLRMENQERLGEVTIRVLERDIKPELRRLEKLQERARANG